MSRPDNLAERLEKTVTELVRLEALADAFMRELEVASAHIISPRTCAAFDQAVAAYLSLKREREHVASQLATETIEQERREAERNREFKLAGGRGLPR